MGTTTISVGGVADEKAIACRVGGRGREQNYQQTQHCTMDIFLLI